MHFVSSIAASNAGPFIFLFALLAVLVGIGILFGWAAAILTAIGMFVVGVVIVIIALARAFGGH